MFTIMVIFEDQIHKFVKDTIAEAYSEFNELKRIFSDNFAADVKLFGPGRLRNHKGGARFGHRGGQIEMQ